MHGSFLGYNLGISKQVTLNRGFVMDIYREQIIDLYEHPLNYGEVEGADFSYEEDNPLCGDVIRVEVKLDENGRVAKVSWSGDGCAISQASASLLTEEIKGMTLDEVKAFDKDTLLELIGVPDRDLK